MASGALPFDSLSVVVPVYNSETILRHLVERLAPLASRPGLRFEVLLVNDGSRDGSWAEIRRLCDGRPWLRGLDLMRNYGQHAAILCGIRHARHEVIVTLDDDLQHPPEEIPALLGKLGEGHDVVYGTPRVSGHNAWRNTSSILVKLALRTVMGAQTAQQVSAFRAFRAELREAFARHQSPYPSIDVLLTWGTTRFAAVPVEHAPRRWGRSNYDFFRLASVALAMVTGFSTLPLRLASLVGFAFTLFGLLVFVWVVGRYVMLGYSVPGFPFLASIVAIFSGAQLFALGIIGEYLARMHLRMLEWPAYAVRENVETTVSGQPRNFEAPT